MPLVVLALCLALGFSARAQEQKKLTYQLKFSPLALVDPNTPVVQFGPQVSLRRLAFSGEFGFTFPALQKMSMQRSDSLFIDQRHHKIRLETKYFLGPDKENWFFAANPYVSVEGFWVARTFRRYQDVVIREEGTYSYDYSDMSRNVLGSCFKFGIEPVVRRCWVLDIFGGFGVRRLAVSHQPEGLRMDPYQTFPLVVDAFTRADRREGTRYRPHLALGFKIGFLVN